MTPLNQWKLFISSYFILFHHDEQTPLVPLPTFFGSIASDGWMRWQTQRVAHSKPSKNHKNLNGQTYRKHSTSNKHPDCFSLRIRIGIWSFGPLSHAELYEFRMELSVASPESPGSSTGMNRDATEVDFLFTSLAVSEIMPAHACFSFKGLSPHPFTVIQHSSIC
jgi:hypothetical protein